MFLCVVSDTGFTSIYFRDVVVLNLVCEGFSWNSRNCRYIQRHIDDGAFLGKYLIAYSRELFFQKVSIVDVPLGSKYTFDILFIFGIF